ncbi:Hint domain-containing protein [Myxococcus sp. K38C18041901]|uniref:Hint domain-containing protein n=1 Tax=Myxococcus guangdongensis TaxID=2906760 RepID=UPI0020A77722|nr:Hint domain-containing protein [Myxococcus guangdongensis]MCP3061950.1 Hint domain-containing protein [Myxococcus guangdongensis]
MSRMRHLLVMGSTACLAFLSGCSSGPRDEQGVEFGRTLQGLGDSSRLSKAEWTTYLSDERYVQELTKPDVRIRLNMADPAQYRFARSRLKLAGKTAENSPYLFEAIEQRRRDHVAKGYTAGHAAEDERGAATPSGIREIHSLETSSSGDYTPEPNDGRATAISTYPGGSYYTYTDTSFSDASGFPLGDLAWVEHFDSGKNVAVNAQGDLSRTSIKRYRVSTYKAEDTKDGFTDSFQFTEFGSEVSAAGNSQERPMLTGLTVQAPKDLVLNDGVISVCLNRTWTGDCDYNLTDIGYAVRLPLKGQVSVSSNHIFDEATINRYKNETLAGESGDRYGFLKLILTNDGGGCDLTDSNVRQARMSQFWSRVSLSANKKTFYWDLTDAYSAFFDDDCRQVQAEVKFTAKIILPLVEPTADSKPYQSSVSLSTAMPDSRFDYTFPKITVTNSCLAAGTQIELAEGAATPIESVKIGDKVNHPERPALTVMDTAVGVETVPMVRIRSESGHSLLMTEMHPIQVMARGMVQARFLKQGDVVMTRKGPSKLVEVRREPFAGKVYNVKVGSDAEKLALGADQTTVYANGFLVGDGQIQQKYETLAMTQKDGNVLAKLPRKWHRDYVLAAKRR